MCNLFKTIYRLKPEGSWRIGEVENWLCYMSEKGWHLKGIGVRFAKFTKGEPEKIKYRVEVSSKSEFLSDEQIAMYKEFGWSCVDHWFNDGFRRFYVFSSPEELNAPELHTDPAEQSYTLKDLNRNLRDGILLIGLLVLLTLGMFYSTFFTDNTPYLNLVRHSLLFIPLTTMLFFLGGLLSNFFALRKLKKRLSDGKFIDHKANWRPALFLTRCNCIALIIIIVSLLLYGYNISHDQVSSDLPLADAALPIVFLSETEGVNNFSRNDWDYNRRYTNHSLFTSVNYYTMENWKTTKKNTKDEVYTASLCSTVYKVHFEAMVPKIVEDMVSSSPIKYKNTTNDNFDFLYINKSAYGFNIIASRGHGIIELQYTGATSLDNILTALSNKLELIE